MKVNSIFLINYSNTDDNTDVSRFEYRNNAFITPTAEGGDVNKIDSFTIKL